MSGNLARDWRAAAFAVAGGVIIAVGAVLPWMSLFAGLQSYRGIAGLYGRLAFAAGALAIIGGVVMLTRPHPRLRLAIGGLGVALTLFATWVLMGLRATTQHLRASSLSAPAPGTGTVRRHCGSARDGAAPLAFEAPAPTCRIKQLAG